MERDNREREKDYQIEYFKEKIEGHESRIKILETMTSEMMKISLILESQQESNRKQDETLNKINENLNKLNYKSDRLSERVDGLEVEVKAQTEGNTIKINDLLRKVGWTVLSLVIGAGLGWIFTLFQGG